MKEKLLSVAKICTTVLLGFNFATLIVVTPSLADSNQQFGSLDSDNYHGLSNDSTGLDPMSLMQKLAQQKGDLNLDETDQNITNYQAEQNKRLQSPQKTSNSSSSSSAP
jgi:hypothetical protein